MVLKIVPCLVAMFLMVSCATKEMAKIKPAVIPKTPQPAQEVARGVPEPPPKSVQQPKRAEIRVEEGEQEKFMVLNFVNADIDAVISAVAGMLNLNYVLSPQVKGKVTIQSFRRFPVKDLFSVFQTLLDMNGLAIVRDGGVCRIVPVEAARQQPTDVVTGRDVTINLNSGFVTQVIPLEYVKARDIVDTVRNLMPRGVDMTVYEPSNLLIVSAPSSALQKFIKLLDALDIPSTDRQSSKTFVYYVENSDAKKLAETLKNLYSLKREEGSRPVSLPTSPGAPPSLGQPGQGGASTVTVGAVSGELEGEVIITTFEDINALVIKGSPRSYLVLLETLKKLDIPTKQVVIEVLIMEVSLTDATQFGVEWLLKGTRKGADVLGGVTSSALPGTVSASIDSDTGRVLDIITTPPTGSDVSTAFAAVIYPERYGLLINAFSSMGKVNVLASPHILATDNKEARIEIGEEIPIATGYTTTTTTSTTSAGLVSAGQIQYRQTGVILTVTPHISEKNMVKLKISQEISSRGADVSLAGITSPSFTKRKAETMGAVQSGSTLLIGGLIQEQKNSSREGIPLLYKIPLLGYLFGATTDETRKSELLLMVTPHVINSAEEADAYAREFENKVKSIKKRLEEQNKEEK